MRFKEWRGQEGILQGTASSTFRITTSISLAHSHAAYGTRQVARDLASAGPRLGRTELTGGIYKQHHAE
jgi:hypothetical protein